MYQIVHFLRLLPCRVPHVEPQLANLSVVRHQFGKLRHIICVVFFRNAVGIVAADRERPRTVPVDERKIYAESKSVFFARGGKFRDDVAFACRTDAVVIGRLGIEEAKSVVMF